MVLKDENLNSETRRQVRKHRERRTSELKRRVEESIRPVLVEDEEGRAQMVGSCVLLVVHDRIFAISADHVFKESRRALMYLGIGSELVGLKHDIVRGRTPDLETDVGITEVTDLIPSELSGERLHSVIDADPNEICSDGQIYIGFGFPGTRVDLDARKRHVEAKGISSSGTGMAGHCEALGFTPFTHVAMVFSKRKMWTGDTIQRAPDPYGMSGGGLFRFDSLWDTHDRPELLSKVVFRRLIQAAA